MEHQIFPLLGEKLVGDITAADLNEYFRYLTQQEILQKNPMNSVPMIKKANFMAAQNKEDLPTQETVIVFTPEKIE